MVADAEMEMKEQPNFFYTGIKLQIKLNGVH